MAIILLSTYSSMCGIAPMAAVYLDSAGKATCCLIAFFGNSAYNMQYLQCIWTYCISLIPGKDITDSQKICNKPSGNWVELWGCREFLSILFTPPKTISLGLGCCLLPCSFVYATCCLKYSLTGMATNLQATWSSILCPPSLEDYLELW